MSAGCIHTLIRKVLMDLHVLTKWRRSASVIISWVGCNQRFSKFCNFSKELNVESFIWPNGWICAHQCKYHLLHNHNYYNVLDIIFANFNINLSSQFCHHQEYENEFYSPEWVDWVRRNDQRLEIIFLCVLTN